jgi:TPR repeat protein
MKAGHKGTHPMNNETPVEAHRRYCRRVWSMREIADIREQVRQTRALFEEWKGVFARLMQESETGDPEVWNVLGDAYHNGRGTERDQAQAMHWFRRAAEAGHTVAMVRLASCYRSLAVDDHAMAAKSCCPR